ncbi:hypothetical protein N7676_15795 [Stenotrophomonas sp. GD03993]|uniref:hypothetical protein n=1 Tax=unclassified Stenotrophomonas TaxID=196198 RepID=UPI002447D03E|nr:MULTISPECIES: hypothetical protein [unclassified Stenotrophomonas]MDH0190257.1 hypothetical protein [Stenotrophomonas sp. GD04051]MDH0465269.1 hypothetical protein [Stenotrophomonas sp. GD03993]MDH0877886.1 hypothetical protein [Stenotrophomonas sp. GD03877]
MYEQNSRHAIDSGTGKKFDPVDLAMLSVGWTEANQALTCEDAEYLTEVAAMLWTLFFDVCPDGYPGVYAYEISEELGRVLAQAAEQDLAAAERTARGWVVAELEKYNVGRPRVSEETATFENEGWKLVAERGHALPDGSGRDAQLLVHSPCGERGTLACALGEWTCGSVAVPVSIWDWLESITEDANRWIAR